MSSEAFSVKVVTPKGVVHEGEAVFAKVPGMVGEIGILPNHTASLSVLKPGELQLNFSDQNSDSFFLSEGLAHITQDSLVILTPYLEKVSAIDKGRAESARSRALKRIQEESRETELDIERAKKSFERAEMRLGLLNKVL